MPGDPRPYLTQAGIYSRAAYTAAASETDDRAGAVLDDLALSIDRLEAAIAREPADWSIRYRAGVATLNLLLAGQYAAGLEPELDYATLIPTVPGLEDWSALVSVSLPLPPPGATAGSLVANATSLATATKARDLSRDMISEIAAEFLRAAHERNPLAPQPVATGGDRTAQSAIEKVRGEVLSLRVSDCGVDPAVIVAPESAEGTRRDPSAKEETEALEMVQ